MQKPLIAENKLQNLEMKSQQMNVNQCIAATKVNRRNFLGVMC